MSRAPFDTTRLDEECERIAAEYFASDPKALAFQSGPYRAYGASMCQTGGERVRDIILGLNRMWADDVLRNVFGRCLRPKVVPA